MSNPLHNEEDIFERIRNNKLSISPDVWSVLAHHIGNDIQVILLCVEHLRQTPEWILNVGSFVIKVLHKLTRQPGFPPKNLVEVFDYIHDKSKSIVGLLEKLKESSEYSNS